MSGWEITGALLGVLGVWLMIRQNIWGWPVGLVQVSVYAWVFYEAKLYSDVILQGFFFGLQAYGWVHWLGNRGARETSPASGPPDGGAAAPTLPVTRLTPAAMAAWVAIGAIVSAAWGTSMQRATDAALPHWDAFILVFSLIAQWLQARKKLECWAGWIIVNTVAIGVYWAKDLFLTAGLYALFWLMAAWGWREWRRTMGGARR